MSVADRDFVRNVISFILVVGVLLFPGFVLAQSEGGEGDPRLGPDPSGKADIGHPRPRSGEGVDIEPQSREAAFGPDQRLGLRKPENNRKLSHPEPGSDPGAGGSREGPLSPGFGPDTRLGPDRPGDGQQPHPTPHGGG